jgi:hypothetical protein
MATIPALTALDEAGASTPAERTTLKAFLQRHPVVHQLLMEAEAPLRAAFGADVTLTLTVETDPESPGWDYLVASIQTPWPVEQAQACLAAFDATWWLAQTPRAQDAFVFDLACL